MMQKTSFVAVALAGFLMAGTALCVKADTCEDRVRRAEENLRKQVDRHGESSKQAEHARHNLDNERGKCHMDERRDHHDDDHRDDDHHDHDHDRDHD